MKGGRWKEVTGKFNQKLGKLRYPILILLLGLIFLLIPGKEKGKQSDTGEQLRNQKQSFTDLCLEERRLSELLSRVKGAGKVEVILSLANGGETTYQSDSAYTQQSGEHGQSSREEQTVLYHADSNTQSPLIRQETAPTYKGALILCQGADDPAVKLALVQAISSLTGLGSDRIAVIKMN